METKEQIARLIASLMTELNSLRSEWTVAEIMNRIAYLEQIEKELANV